MALEKMVEVERCGAEVAPIPAGDCSTICWPRPKAGDPADLRQVWLDDLLAGLLPRPALLLLLAEAATGRGSAMLGVLAALRVRLMLPARSRSGCGRRPAAPAPPASALT